MKFLIHGTDNGYTVLRFDDLKGQEHFMYIGQVDMGSILQGRLTIVSDNAILAVDAHSMVYYPSILHRITFQYKVQGIPVDALWIKMDTRNFFTQALRNIDRLGRGKRFTLDSQSFQFRRQEDNHRPMTFSQILSHRNFHGRESLLFAVRCKIPRRKFVAIIQSPFNPDIPYDEFHNQGLREMLSLYLNLGAIICNDGANCPSFYFYPDPDQKKLGYNGGIIYHGAYDGYGSGQGPTFAVTLSKTDGWSVHT